MAGATEAEAIVYNIGALFEGNRYVVRHGRIVQMDVWNDSAEWLLQRAGLVP